MLNSILGSELTLVSFLICTAVSLLLGVGTALVSIYRSRTTQSFAVTLAILPAVVQLVIMLVNGNLGAGVAVAGAFGLVRFRSAPGTAKEIGALFLAMAIGLATGMGYVWLAVMAFAIVSTVMLLLTALVIWLSSVTGSFIASALIAGGFFAVLALLVYLFAIRDAVEQIRRQAETVYEVAHAAQTGYEWLAGKVSLFLKLREELQKK